MRLLAFILPLLVSTAFAALPETDRGNVEYQKNYLKNPGGEYSKAGVTASGGSLSTSTTRSAGNKSITWDSSAAAQTLIYSTIGQPAQLGTAVVTARFNVRCDSGTCTHKLQIWDATAGVAINEVTIESSTTVFKEVAVSGSYNSANTIQVRFISVASNEPLLYIDEGWFGRARELVGLAGSNFEKLLTFVPNSGAFGTVSATSYSHRRVGDSMEVIGYFKLGTVAGGDAYITMPTGYAIDSGKLGTAQLNILGFGNRVKDAAGAVNIGSNGDLLRFFYDGSDTAKIYMTNATASGTLNKVAGTAIASSSDEIPFHLFIPIVGWNANVTMASTAGNPSEVRLHTSSAMGAVGTKVMLFTTIVTTGTGATGTNDSNAGSYVTINEAGVWCAAATTQLTGATQWGITFNTSGAATTSYASLTEPQQIAGNTNSANLASSAAGCRVMAIGDSIRIHTDGTAGTGDKLNKLTVTRVANSSLAGVLGLDSLPAARAYNSATSISGTPATIVWTTEEYDTASALASGVFTCPRVGKYQFNVGLAIAGTFILNNTSTLELQKNGTTVSGVTHYIAAAITNEHVQLSDLISCTAKGDTFRVQYSTNGTSPSIVSSDTRNFFSVTNVGF